MRNTMFLLTLILLAGVIFTGVVAAAENGEEPAVESQSEFLEHFSVTFRNLTYGTTQKPADSVFNVDNEFEVARYTLASDFRPDVSMRYSRLEAMVKPRWDFSWERCEDGVCNGDEDSDEHAYINEWLVRVEPVDSLFLSYGREDLQWGPAYMLSPSNPFYSDNGSYNPKMEVPGADYARIVWSPNMQWAGSLIVNTDEGRKELWDDFHKTYALKLDHTADRGYFSLILAKQESGDSHVGFFASWNVNDAFVAYTEESVRDDDLEALVGATYTFGNGSTFAIEYFHNGAGDSSGDLLETIVDEQGLDDRLILSRKNYLLLQYYYREPLDRWNALLRGTFNLDDNSNALLGQMEYNLTNHAQLFANGTVFSGEDDDELGGLLDYRVMTGVEFSF